VFIFIFLKTLSVGISGWQTLRSQIIFSYWRNPVAVV